MNTQHQAYIDGFVKRAAEYGFNEDETLYFLKKTAAALPGQTRPILRGALSPREREYDQAIQQQIAYNNQNPLNWESSKPATEMQQQNNLAGQGYHAIDATGRGIGYMPQAAREPSTYTQTAQNSTGYDQPIGPTQPEPKPVPYGIGTRGRLFGETANLKPYTASMSSGNSPSNPAQTISTGTNLTGEQPSVSPLSSLASGVAKYGPWNGSTLRRPLQLAVQGIKNNLNKPATSIASALPNLAFNNFYGKNLLTSGLK